MIKGKKIMALYVIAAIFFTVLDRFFKMLALEIGENSRIHIFDSWFSFSLAKNQYIAFSLPFTGLLLNIVIGVIIISIIIFSLILIKKQEYHQAGLLTILVISAINNYYDRLRYGYVIDYLDLRYFTVLNISDILISLSTILLIWAFLRK
jgi:signal peptidase II